MSAEAPMYVTVALVERGWGVGRLWQHTGGTWVEVKREGLRFEDAADLRDAWNARGNEERK